MKKIFYILTFTSSCFFFTSANAQIGNLKSKLPNTSKEKEKESPKPANAKEATSSKSSTGTDFKELESKKMEWTSTFERLEKQWDKLPYDEYTAEKATYGQFYNDFSAAYKKSNGKDHQDTYTQKLITKIDSYYTDKVTEAQMNSLKSKVKRSFDDKDWTVYPSDRVEDIETAERMVDNMKVYLKGQDADLLEYEKTLKTQKEKIIEYVASGGLEKRDAEIEKAMVGKRTLHTAGMTDANVNATVTSKINKEKYGTPLRTVITSKSWEIERDNYGQIKLKFVRVEIATKKSNGKCYFVKGSVAQKYEGGGRYGDQYLNIYYTEGEMNCANTNK